MFYLSQPRKQPLQDKWRSERTRDFPFFFILPRQSKSEVVEGHMIDSVS